GRAVQWVGRCWRRNGYTCAPGSRTAAPSAGRARSDRARSRSPRTFAIIGLVAEWSHCPVMSNVYSLTQRPAPEESSMPGLNTTEEIIEELRAGRMVIIMDDEDRENEGD